MFLSQRATLESRYSPGNALLAIRKAPVFLFLKASILTTHSQEPWCKYILPIMSVPSAFTRVLFSNPRQNGWNISHRSPVDSSTLWVDSVPQTVWSFIGACCAIVWLVVHFMLCSSTILTDCFPSVFLLMFFKQVRSVQIAAFAARHLCRRII